jgi:hypothetical protein
MYGRRRFLVLSGLIYAGFASSYIAVPPSSEDLGRYYIQLLLMPLWMWGCAWAVVGVIATACGFSGWLRLGFSLSWLMSALWAAGSTLSWVLGILGVTPDYSTRGLLTAGVWTLAALSVFTVSGPMEADASTATGAGPH